MILTFFRKNDFYGGLNPGPGKDGNSVWNGTQFVSPDNSSGLPLPNLPGSSSSGLGGLRSGDSNSDVAQFEIEQKQLVAAYTVQQKQLLEAYNLQQKQLLEAYTKQQERLIAKHARRLQQQSRGLKSKQSKPALETQIPPTNGDELNQIQLLAAQVQKQQQVFQDQFKILQTVIKAQNSSEPSILTNTVTSQEEEDWIRFGESSPEKNNSEPRGETQQKDQA